MNAYNIEHDDTSWECRIEINHEKAKDGIKECVEFWSGWESNLDDNDGDYTQTFLKQLAHEIHREVTNSNLNEYGIIELFKRKEGWLPLDGSEGVKLKRIDDSTFRDDQYLITKIK